MWLSLLISQVRKGYSQGQTLQHGRAKVAAAEAEGILTQIGVESCKTCQELSRPKSIKT